MTREWSIQQNKIFNWFANEKNHLVVRARAGTGKTTVIIEGIKRAPERSILICAFSKIIQVELQERFGKTWDGQPETRPVSHIEAKTLHSVGYACVRRFRDRIKVEFNESRAVALTDAVCGNRPPDTIKRLVTKLHTKGREVAPHAKDLGDLTDIAYTFDCIPDEQWNSLFPLEYVETKALEAMELAAGIQSGGTIDGSDMVFLPVRNGWLTPMYDLIVVDECQDMSQAQLEIAQGVLNKDGRIALVGDNRQAIFGFRGADSGSLDRLKSELCAEELGLTTTYRCPKSVVRLAQELVPDFDYGPENPEGEILEMTMLEMITAAGPSDFILSRINAPLVSVAMKLLRSGKRTRIAGRDIGKGLVTLARKFAAKSVPDFLRRVESWESRELTRHQSLYDAAVPARKRSIETKMEAVRDQAEMLLSLADGAKNITEIVNRIENLFSDTENEGMITCSSIHRAKGLEANRVFIFQDTLRTNSEEEINISYVAITRSKQTLVWVTNGNNGD